jgi:prepilin peptidase CpaA
MESLVRMLRVDVTSIPFAVVLVTVLVAGIVDQRRHRVPNSITFGLILSGLAYHLTMLGGDGLSSAIWGFVFGLSILLPWFVLGGLGAADVKLFAGIGCWIGLHDTVAVFMVFGTLYGVFAAVILIRERWRRESRHDPSRRWFGSQRIEEVLSKVESERDRMVIPLAPIMAAAILLLALWPATEAVVKAEVQLVDSSQRQ